MNQARTTNVKPKKGLYIFLLVAAFLLLSCLSPIGWFIFQIHRSVKQSLVEADSGFRRATNSINAEDLRAWALEMVRKRASEKEVYDSLPSNLKNLYSEPPEIAEIDGSCVNLLWGGGFFHWGFYIGGTNETMPFISDNTEYPYNFEWRPGIYYTREAKWNLQ